MSKYRYKISLRLWHASQNLNSISDILALTPSRIWRNGDDRTDIKGQKIGGIYENNYWSADISKGTADISSLAIALENAVELLSQNSEFFTNFVADGGTAELFIGWFMDGFNTGDVIGWRLLQSLAQLRLNLAFDLYGSLEED